MATRVRLRRGTTAEHASFTGVVGELTVDTDRNTVKLHDGSTAGGLELLRTDKDRGWTRSEHFLNDDAWTKNNKEDLKRIEVHVWGGGGGGADDTNGGSGGGSGGYGYRVIDISEIATQNVTVTIGSGGAAGSGGGDGSAGAATSFGSFISANGGAAGVAGAAAVGGDPGNVSGTNVINMGGFAGQPGASGTYGAGGGPGGKKGNAEGYRGGGGGAGAGAGAQGSVLVYEIYGEVE
jgi:hypothetical protein